MDDSDRAPSMTDVAVDWDAVEPAAAGSLRMALALGAQLENAAAVEARCEAATAAYVDAHAAEAAAEDEEEPSATERDGDAETGAGGAAPSNVGLSSRQGEAPDDDDNDDADEEGMGAPADSMASMGAAEPSDGDDISNWRLVAVKRRRRRKATGVVESDLDAAYSDTDVRFEYLCEWRHVRESAQSAPPLVSWELRGWLLDAGFTRNVEAYDASLLPTPHAGGTKEVAAPARVVIGLAYDLACTYDRDHHGAVLKLLASRNQFSTSVDADVEARVLNSKLGTLKHINRSEALLIWGLAKAIADRANRKGLTVWCGRPRFLTPETLGRFEGTTQGAKNVAGVKLLYHGTSDYCARAIATQGLLVPGDRGVSVRHGSAYGVGIYAADGADFAYGYTEGGSGAVLVCVACGPPSAQAHCFSVYARSTQIVPIIRLEARRRWRF